MGWMSHIGGGNQTQNMMRPFFDSNCARKNANIILKTPLKAQGGTTPCSDRQTLSSIPSREIREDSCFCAHGSVSNSATKNVTVNLTTPLDAVRGNTLCNGSHLSWFVSGFEISAHIAFSALFFASHFAPVYVIDFLKTTFDRVPGKTL